MSLLVKLSICYCPIILLQDAFLHPFPIFQGKIKNDRKMYGSFLTMLGMAWAPNTLLKQFGSATEEKQETNHRNEQK